METSLSYFGARYYEAGLSVWLSVDPLSDRYLSHTPYNYMMNNPVRLVDPDGRSVICETCPAGEEWDAFRNDNANWFYNAESNSATSIQNGEINISTTFYNEKVDGVAHDRYFSSLQAEAVIEALVMLGFDRDKAAQDVKPVNRYHAELQNSEFYMKALPMEAFDSKNWETPARQSKQLGNSLYALKLYPGRDNAIGLVYSDSYYHTLEAGAEILELLVGTILGPHYMHENNALGFLNAVK